MKIITELTKALESVEGFISSIVSKFQLSMLSMGNYRCIRSIFSVLLSKLLNFLVWIPRSISSAQEDVEGESIKERSIGIQLKESPVLFSEQVSILSQESFYRRSSRGVILIMLACFLPIILLGIKYSEKLIEEKEEQFKKVGEEVVTKRCAREAALEVARNWNPGLTLSQQQEGVYKVADNIYNKTPSYQTSILGRAIPGFLESNGNSLSSSNKQIKYTDVGCYNNIYCVNNFITEVFIYGIRTLRYGERWMGPATAAKESVLLTK